jgi:lysophospholipase L1-like esterase
MPFDRRTLLLGALAVAVGCSTKVSSAPAATGLPGDTGVLETAPPADGLPDPAAPAGGGGASPSPTSLAMIGDSITEASTPALKAVLANAGFSKLTIDGDTGRRIDEGTGKKGEPLAGTKVLAKLVAQGVDPDVWVIALGTNDVGHYDSDPSEYDRLIDELVAQIPKSKPLVWVDTFVSAQPKATLTWNALVRRKMSARGHAKVANWYAEASDPKRNILRKDDLHPNDNGVLVFADLVSTAATTVT